MPGILDYLKRPGMSPGLGMLGSYLMAAGSPSFNPGSQGQMLAQAFPAFAEAMRQARLDQENKQYRDMQTNLMQSTLDERNQAQRERQQQLAREDAVRNIITGPANDMTLARRAVTAPPHPMGQTVGLDKGIDTSNDFMANVPQEQRPYLGALAQLNPSAALTAGFNASIKDNTPFTLGENQTRYDASGNTIAKGPSKLVGIPSGYELDPSGIGLRPIKGGPDDPTTRANLAAAAARAAAMAEPSRGQQGGAYMLPSGVVVGTRFNPKGGEYEYKDEKGNWTPVPAGARPVTLGTGGYLNPEQYLKAQSDFNTDINGLKRLNTYAQTVGGLDTGLTRWAEQVSAKAKNLLSSQNSKQELQNQIASGQLQGLLGLFRTDVVGPGVMTEYDAQRVTQALGGDINALQNPQVVKSLLGQMYDSKMSHAKLLQKTIGRNAPAFGEDAPAIDVPQSLLGQAPLAAPQTPGPDIPLVQTPADAMKLPPGTKFRTPDGRIKVR